MNMKWFRSGLSSSLVFAVMVGMGLGCSPAEEGSHSSQEANAANVKASTEKNSLGLKVPEEFQPGEERFTAFCSRCHGVDARGTSKGPPLVHKIYEPSHHGDFAFLRAAAQGVRAHHWDFGNMPKIEDASPDDMKLIIPYVRWLQREAGIF